MSLASIDQQLAFHIETSAVIFERSDVDFPSAEEQRQLKKGTRWSLWAYMMWGGALVTAAYSYTKKPTDEEKAYAAARVKKSLFNSVKKFEADQAAQKAGKPGEEPRAPVLVPDNRIILPP